MTPNARDSIIEIVDWTYRNFGPKQAQKYEAELIKKCDSISTGNAVSQNCSVLIDEKVVIDVKDMNFVRADRHFIFFQELPDQIRIVDFIHTQRNIVEIVANLSNKYAPESKLESEQNQPRDIEQNNFDDNEIENDFSPKLKF